MKELFSLGELYVSDFIKDDSDYTNRKKYEMKFLLDEETGAVRLETQPPKETMWGKYWYRSGTNQTMREQLKDVVDCTSKMVSLKPLDTWLDIACNDGTLLSYVDKSLIRVGCDPCEDSFVEESQKHADCIIQDYFSKEAVGNIEPKVVTTIAMFYDLSEPSKFIRDVYNILEDDGIWTVQIHYTPLMLKQMEFSNFVHEHSYYYSLFNLKKLFEDNGFRIINCSLNETNGGSLRVYAVKDKADVTNFGTQQQRDVWKINIESLLEWEKTLNLDKSETWTDFKTKIDELKEQTLTFLHQAKSEGKRVFGYGASSKGNTFLQYFGIDSSLIEYMVERSPYKFGLKTIGSNIPIISEEQSRELKPDFMFVLPWFFISEFVKREKEFLDEGGKFVVPCPKFEIIGSETKR